MPDLPIDVVPNTAPPQFRWSQVLDGFGGKQTLQHVGSVYPSMESALIEVVAMAKRSFEESVARGKLQAFKDWVHAYLDSKGVPEAPPGTHGAEGCRIGDRMDWVFAKLEFTYCAYCGHQCPMDTDGGDVAGHIRTCEKHPMRAVEAELERVNAEVADVVAELATSRKMNEDLTARVAGQSELLSKKAEAPKPLRK